MEWPRRLDSDCNAISVGPPYRAGAYIQALTGSPPRATITVTLGAGTQLSLKTPYGQPLTALEAGTYTFSISDRSPRESFHLLGPGTSRSTGIRAVKTTTWTLNLRPGTYRYRSDRPKSKPHGAFIVLPTD